MTLIDYVAVGCYKDTADRTIPIVEGTDPILDGAYKSRQNVVEKCAVVARRKSFHMFAVQDGGWCVTSATAEKTFDKYGKSNDCRTDGEGGGWANNVYTIQGWSVSKKIHRSCNISRDRLKHFFLKSFIFSQKIV